MSNVLDFVRSFFEKRGWKYSYVESNQQLSAGFNVSGKIRNIRMSIDFGYEDCYIVLSPISIHAPVEAYPEILRLINHINFTSKFGTFELDERDGEIRYRITVECAGQLPSLEAVERSILLPIQVIQDNAEKMFDIILNGKTFDEIKESLDKDIE